MHRFLLAIALAVALCFSSSATAQDVSTQLQRAQHLELIAGDIQGAASIYRRVSESVSSTRSDVARSLSRLALALERMGDADGAIHAYTRIATEFGDQVAVFEHAQSRLRALSHAATPPVSDVRNSYELLIPELPPFQPNRPAQYDFSADGSQILMLTPVRPDRKARYPELEREIYIVDLQAGTAPRPLVSDPGRWQFFGHPRWSPNGSSVYFVAMTAPGPEADSGGFIYDVRTGQSRRLTSGEGGGGASDAVWAPDGGLLAVRYRSDLVLFRPDGTEIRRLENVFHSSRAIMGTIRPSGDRMVFGDIPEESQINAHMDLWTVDLKTGDLDRMTDRIGVDTSPVWDRDGTSVVFVSDRSGSMNLFRRSPDGTVSPLTEYSNSQALYPRLLGSGAIAFSLVSLTQEVMIADSDRAESARMVARGGRPSISNDGTAIGYVSESGRELRVVHPETGESSILLEGELVLVYGPARWLSPDGRRAAAFVYEGESSVLYAVSVEGGNPRRLYSMDIRREVEPSWSPDSREIAFADGEKLIVVPADGGRPVVLAEAPQWEPWSARWSPDGTQIAAFAYPDPDNTDVNQIMVVDRASGAMRQVTPDSEAGYKEILDWHPSGDRISYMYYGSDWEGEGSRLLDLNTGTIRDLPNLAEPMWDYIGVWGPDERYYFVAGPRGFGNLNAVYASDVRSGAVEPFRALPGRTAGLPDWAWSADRVTWSESMQTRQLWKLTDR